MSGLKTKNNNEESSETSSSDGLSNFFSAKADKKKIKKKSKGSKKTSKRRRKKVAKEVYSEDSEFPVLSAEEMLAVFYGQSFLVVLSEASPSKAKDLLEDCSLWKKQFGGFKPEKLTSTQIDALIDFVAATGWYFGDYVKAVLGAKILSIEGIAQVVVTMSQEGGASVVKTISCRGTEIGIFKDEHFEPLTPESIHAMVVHFCDQCGIEYNFRQGMFKKVCARIYAMSFLQNARGFKGMSKKVLGEQRGSIGHFIRNTDLTTGKAADEAENYFVKHPPVNFTKLLGTAFGVMPDADVWSIRDVRLKKTKIQSNTVFSAASGIMTPYDAFFPKSSLLKLVPSAIRKAFKRQVCCFGKSDDLPRGERVFEFKELLRFLKRGDAHIYVDWANLLLKMKNVQDQDVIDDTIKVKILDEFSRYCGRTGRSVFILTNYTDFVQGVPVSQIFPLMDIRGMFLVEISIDFVENFNRGVKFGQDSMKPWVDTRVGISSAMLDSVPYGVKKTGEDAFNIFYSRDHDMTQTVLRGEDVPCALNVLVLKSNLNPRSMKGSVKKSLEELRAKAVKIDFSRYFADDSSDDQDTISSTTDNDVASSSEEEEESSEEGESEYFTQESGGLSESEPLWGTADDKPVDDEGCNLGEF
jgi:hypothetical protein